MGYKVKIDAFEGPFDLLVYLIENARMSIYDIRVSEITSQYIAYIEEMDRVDAEVSSEFMVLAAELIELKSKMLLPHAPSEEDDIPDEDPRADLVRKLLEYKRFKAASAMLGTRWEEGRLTFEKPREDISEYTESPDEIFTLTMPQFAAAFIAFLEKKRRERRIHDNYLRVGKARAGAEERAAFIKNLFSSSSYGSGESEKNFKELIPDPGDSYDIALSFSTMLEMIRQRRLTARQAALYSDIYVKATDHINDTEESTDDKQIFDKIGV